MLYEAATSSPGMRTGAALEEPVGPGAQLSSEGREQPGGISDFSKEVRSSSGAAFLRSKKEPGLGAAVGDKATSRKAQFGGGHEGEAVFLRKGCQSEDMYRGQDTDQE